LLFNVFQDPTEHNNLFSSMPAKVAQLQQLIQNYEQDYRAAQPNWFHPTALPTLHHGVWAPFKAILKAE
jgi:hypothetical protein